MLGNPRQMAWSPVTLVPLPLPPRVVLSQIDHQSIPVDLRNSGRSRNAEESLVCLERRQYRFKSPAQFHCIDDNPVTRTSQ